MSMTDQMWERFRQGVLDGWRDQLNARQRCVLDDMKEIEKLRDQINIMESGVKPGGCTVL